MCNNNTNFLNRFKGYRVHCSTKCAMSNKTVKDKIVTNGKKTKLARYGNENYNNSNKIKETLKKYNKNSAQHIQKQHKIKQNNIKKYGVEHYFQTNDFKEKSRLKCIQKYGVEHQSKVPIIKEKVKQTKSKKYKNNNYDHQKQQQNSLKKYGYTHYTKAWSVNGKLKKQYNSQRILYYKKYNKDLTLLNLNIYELTYQHNICSHTFHITAQLLYLRQKHNQQLCTLCNPIQKSYSNAEKEILKFITKNTRALIKHNTRKIIGKELDIYAQALKLAFEYNGLFWHNANHKHKEYHLEKTNLCNQQKIKLIHIWEDDWLFKQNIVQSRILHLLNKTSNTIYARSCEIKRITTKKTKSFLNQNHLQGSTNSKYNMGLLHNNTLVAIMAFKELDNNKFELSRFCTALNIHVVGGITKLFNHFIKNYQAVYIETFFDRCHGYTNIYKVLGFSLDYINTKNYWIIINNKRINDENNQKLKQTEIYGAGIEKLIWTL